MLVLLGYPVEPKHVDRVASIVPDARVEFVAQDELSRRLPEADVFCGHVKVPVDWSAVRSAGKLRWIQSSAAGLDHCLVPDIIHSDVLVSSASGVFAQSVAEHTLALLLGLIRKLPRFMAAFERGEFVRQPTDDLCGKTVCLVGCGGNGSQIARTIRPLGVEILATDWFPQAHPGVDLIGPPERLAELLPRSDVVIITVPLTDQTRHLIGSREIKRIRRSGYLINVARGQVVDEQALVDALVSGHLAGAGLDVTDREPPPPDSPLWQAPNLIVTPHVAAQSAERIDRTTDLFCINLQRYAAGERLFNQVDKSLGFPHPSDRWCPQ